MKEETLAKQVIEWANQQGGRAERLVLVNERGFPDLTLFMPSGEIAFAELKRPHCSRRSVNQEKWISRLRDSNFQAGFCYTLDDVIALFETPTS